MFTAFLYWGNHFRLADKLQKMVHGVPPALPNVNTLDYHSSVIETRQLTSMQYHWLTHRLFFFSIILLFFFWSKSHTAFSRHPFQPVSVSVFSLSFVFSMTLTDLKSTVGYFVVCPSVRVYPMVSCGWIEVMHFQQDAVLFSVTHIKDALLIFNKEILNVVARECVYVCTFSPPHLPPQPSYT